MSDELVGGGLLFCDSRFHDVNEVPVEARFAFEAARAGRTTGVFSGVVVDGVFTSGYSAPFGGPDLVRSDPPVEDVVELVEGTLQALRERSVHRLRVAMRPPEYSPAEPLLEYALLQAGLTVGHCDLNQVVDLARLGATDDPLALLNKKRAREVRLDLAGAFEFVPADGPDDVTTLHGVLAANRAAHGRPPGLGAAYLTAVRDAFPDRVRLRLLRHAGRVVAAAVVYRVLDDVDLLVAWGDDAAHGLPRSPMNLLAHLLLTEAWETGARLLDMGPSSEKDGRPNLGLAHFKRSVGAVPGTRKVLIASLP